MTLTESNVQNNIEILNAILFSQLVDNFQFLDNLKNKFHKFLNSSLFQIVAVVIIDIQKKKKNRQSCKN